MSAERDDIQLPKPATHIALWSGGCIAVLESFDELTEMIEAADEWIELHRLFVRQEEQAHPLTVGGITLTPLGMAPPKENRGYGRFRLRPQFIAHYWDEEQAPEWPS